MQQQGDRHALQAIVEQTKILIAGRTAQKLQTEQMHGASRELGVAVQAGVHIGQVHGQESVVFSNGGAEEKGLLLIEAQREAREVAGFGVKEAETGGTQRLDVAVAVENGEGVAVLEHTGAVVR